MLNIMSKTGGALIRGLLYPPYHFGFLTGTKPNGKRTRREDNTADVGEQQTRHTEVSRSIIDISKFGPHINGVDLPGKPESSWSVRDEMNGFLEEVVGALCPCEYKECSSRRCTENVPFMSIASPRRFTRRLVLWGREMSRATTCWKTTDQARSRRRH